MRDFCSVTSAILVVAAVVAMPVAASAQAAKDPTGANPTDIAPSPAATGAIIDKTHATSGAASGVAPKDTRYLKAAQQAASAGSASGPATSGKRRPAAKGASGAM